MLNVRFYRFAHSKYTCLRSLLGRRRLLYITLLERREQAETLRQLALPHHTLPVKSNYRERKQIIIK